MFSKKMGILVLFILASIAFGQRTFYVLPLNNNLDVYANKVRRMNEEAITSVDKNDRLKVLDTQGTYYQVQTPDGNTGWVETRLVSRTEGTTETFDGIEISGYGDNPTPIIIQDANMSSSAPIDIDRSFQDALLVNADKDMISRTR